MAFKMAITHAESISEKELTGFVVQLDGTESKDLTFQFCNMV